MCAEGAFPSEWLVRATQGCFIPGTQRAELRLSPPERQVPVVGRTTRSRHFPDELPVGTKSGGNRQVAKMKAVQLKQAASDFHRANQQLHFAGVFQSTPESGSRRHSAVPGREDVERRLYIPPEAAC